jgi:hypothetical protein
MEDRDAMRAEVNHLRTLASLATDVRLLEEIKLLIEELEYRVRQSEDGPEETISLE